MDNQRNQSSDHPWQMLDFRRLGDCQGVSPRSVGAEQAEPVDAGFISQSAFLIGSLELDDCPLDRDRFRQQSLLTATSGSSQQSLRDTFMRGLSGSSDAPSSSNPIRPLVGQFPPPGRRSVCLLFVLFPPLVQPAFVLLVNLNSTKPQVPVLPVRLSCDVLGPSVLPLEDDDGSRVITRNTSFWRCSSVITS